MLSPEEQTRYDRQIMIHGFGEAGQEKLKNSKVVIAGAGGLGSPVSIYLAAAGIGYIRIIDRDVVELSNLNRQVLHWHKDIGRKKAESAAEKLKAMNPGITVEGLNIDINETNVEEVVKGFDVIVDAMDNLATRLLLNKAALKLKIPFVHGAIHGFEGQRLRSLSIQSRSTETKISCYRYNPGGYSEYSSHRNDKNIDWFGHAVNQSACCLRRTEHAFHGATFAAGHKLRCLRNPDAITSV
jgi:molybdopterin/thiamine biosynthesis adenylyltransferase